MHVRQYQRVQVVVQYLVSHPFHLVLQYWYH